MIWILSKHIYFFSLNPTYTLHRYILAHKFVSFLLKGNRGRLASLFWWWVKTTMLHCAANAFNCASRFGAWGWRGKWRNMMTAGASESDKCWFGLTATQTHTHGRKETKSNWLSMIRLPFIRILICRANFRGSRPAHNAQHLPSPCSLFRYINTWKLRMSLHHSSCTCITRSSCFLSLPRIYKL